MWKSETTGRQFSNSVLSALLATAACTGLPHAAWADDSPEEETLIRRGVDLRRAHRDAGALALFRQAYAVRPTPRARAQIALAEQSLGQWLDAESDLRAALEAIDDPWIGGNRATLDDALAFVSAHLGWLTVSSNVTGARVAIDGAIVGNVPMEGPVRVAAGTVLLRVEAEGFAPAERTVSIPATDRVQEFLHLAPHPSDAPAAPIAAPAQAAATTQSPTQPLAPPSPTLPSQPKPAPSTPVPWAAVFSGAGGLAGLTVGTIYGINVLTAKAARDEHCHAGRCDPTGLKLDAGARSDAFVSSIAFGLGGAFLVAGAWLFWRETRTAPPIDVVPMTAPRVAGVAILGRF